MDRSNSFRNVRLEGADIVCLGYADWLVVHSLAEYTMLELAKTNRVLYIEPCLSWVTKWRMARSQSREVRKEVGLRRAGENLWIYSPPALGLPGVSTWVWPSHFNGWLFSSHLRRALKKLGFHDPIVWNYVYNASSLAHRIPGRLHLYEFGDNEEAIAKSRRHKQVVRAHEETTCRRADLVLTVTEKLVATRRAFNPHTYEVPCGVDLHFFGRALKEETKVPDDIAALKHPVIGYVGAIDPWRIDVPMLRRIAQRHPDWSIALVGYIWFGFDRREFDGCPNIYLLGRKEYEQFPAYMKGMDVGILPFRLNDITLYGDALKLYEYLAAGLPVVSTDVPVARRFPTTVRTAASEDAFEQFVAEALVHPPASRETRLAIVREHTWEERVNRKCSLIEQRLVERDRSATRTVPDGNVATA